MLVRVLAVVIACGVGCNTASHSAEEPDAAVGDGGGADAVAADAAPRTIDVLTINLKTPFPSDTTFGMRTQLVADLILAEQPDVVALQEVTESGSMTNRGEALAQLTGYAFAWHQTHDFVVSKEGIGILARGTITWHGGHDLPHTEFGLLHRAVLGARVMTEGGPIELYATHLTVAGSTTDRADQAAEALAFARAQHTPGVPAYLAGDLNATPDELAMLVLRGEASHDGTTGDLVDAWPQAMTTPGYTIPSDAPERRIDYIYALPDGGTATTCATVLAQPVDGIRASDHLGVLCRFAVASS